MTAPLVVKILTNEEHRAKEREHEAQFLARRRYTRRRNERAKVLGGTKPLYTGIGC